MIGLEKVHESSVTERNFDKLNAVVLDTGGTGARIRWGVVSATGTVVTGQGFTAARTPAGGVAGDYTVTIGLTIPVTIVLGAGVTGVDYHVKLHATTPPSATGFRVACINAAGALVDGEFHWIAIY